MHVAQGSIRVMMQVNVSYLRTTLLLESRKVILEQAHLLRAATFLSDRCKLSALIGHGALCHFSSFWSSQNPKDSEEDRKRSTRFIVRCNTQLAKYGRNGEIEQAESVFMRMKTKSVVSYTSMLTAYAQNGRIYEARRVFDEMSERTIASYNAMITAYALNFQMIDGAFALFREMTSRNSVSYGAMITGFVRRGMFEKAEELYREMPDVWREPVCSNALMSGYMKAGRLADAAKVFNSMVQKDLFSLSCIVDGYCKAGRLEEARRVFDSMAQKTVVTWCSMIKGYMASCCFIDGIDLFLMMRSEENVDINANTLTTLVDGCGNSGTWRDGIQVHALVFLMGFECDVFLGNSIITLYSKLCRMIEANMAFHYISNKDSVSWNSLLQGYIENNQMDKASEVFDKIPTKDAISWTSLMAGFFADGDVEKSIELFNLMPERDDISWTALISGFVNCGYYEEAIR